MPPCAQALLHRHHHLAVISLGYIQLGLLRTSEIRLCSLRNSHR